MFSLWLVDEDHSTLAVPRIPRQNCPIHGVLALVILSLGAIQGIFPIICNHEGVHVTNFYSLNTRSTPPPPEVFPRQKDFHANCLTK